MRNFRLDDESGHQEALFSWAAYRTEIMPELQYMYHVPNGGKRDKATAAVLKGRRRKERQRMKTISILNLKGGVAKTFTAANMAYELYRRGYKVLLIDNDKQGNLSKAYSRYDAENVAPVTRLLAGDWENADELIQHTEYEGIDIVTANMSLFGATWNLTKEDSENQIERYKALVYAKMQYYGDCTIYGKYDYCIIDNPPDIGLNVVNALAITDEVIVPVKVDEDALEGLDIVTEQIEDAKAFNPALKLAGVLITSYQNTDGEAAGVEWLEQKTDFNILGIIRYSKKVAENTFMRKPIYEYSPCCGAAQGYKKFVTAYTGKAR